MPSKAVVLVRESPAGCPGHPPAAWQPAWRDRPPAALVSVGNRPLLGHALSWLATGGIAEAAIMVPGRLATEVRAAAAEEAPIGLDIHWLEQAPAGTLQNALTGLEHFLGDDPFVLHLADSVARRGLRDLLGDRGIQAGEALLVVHPRPQDRLVDVADLTARRHATMRGLAGLESAEWNFGGIVVAGAGVFADARRLGSTPADEREAVSQLIRALNGRVRTRREEAWWRFRPGPEAQLEGNRFVLQGIQPHYHADSLEKSDIQGAVVIHPTARLESTIVRGPALIGAGARLRNAYIGPYTSIANDVLIEGAEIEHSIILAGASVTHLGGRLEASIVGPHARVFRDFRLPKAMRMNLGAGADVSLA